ncbi:hypothetical protein BC829DRAFT_285499 [Chytridium lagenaria]|nr:hypothetical protein BC829DRAFT_285499 [Chytridium lagenaria]
MFLTLPLACLLLVLKLPFTFWKRHQTPLGASWNVVTVARTDAEGRCGDLIPVVEGIRAGLVAGAVYKLTFGVEEYFRKQSKEAFFPCCRDSV